jgi:nucleoside-diphosphate-sugar epimerase
MTKRKALVTSAAGVVGRYLLMHLLERGGWDIVVSNTDKARRFGFHDSIDTEEMFLQLFAALRSSRIMP